MKIHLPAYEPLFKENEHLRHGEIDIDLGEDVVKVVFCKDCKHWGGITFGNICRRWTGLNVKNCTKPTDYCSYGERKDTE